MTCAHRTHPFLQVPSRTAGRTTAALSACGKVRGAGGVRGEQRLWPRLVGRCLLGGPGRPGRRGRGAMQSSLGQSRVPQEVSTYSRGAFARSTAREFSNSFACQEKKGAVFCTTEYLCSPDVSGRPLPHKRCVKLAQTSTSSLVHESQTPPQGCCSLPRNASPQGRVVGCVPTVGESPESLSGVRTLSPAPEAQAESGGDLCAGLSWSGAALGGGRGSGVWQSRVQISRLPRLTWRPCL